LVSHSRSGIDYVFNSRSAKLAHHLAPPAEPERKPGLTLSLSEFAIVEHARKNIPGPSFFHCGARDSIDTQVSSDNGGSLETEFGSEAGPSVSDLCSSDQENASAADTADSRGGGNSDESSCPSSGCLASARLVSSKVIEVARPAVAERAGPQTGEAIDDRDPRIADLITAAVLRMCASELTHDLSDPLLGADTRDVLIAEENSASWGRLRFPVGGPMLGTFPPPDTDRLCIVGRIGNGHDGTVHLACTVDARAVCAIKEFHDETTAAREPRESTRSKADIEKAVWDRIYGDMFDTRVQKWNGVWRLMMPYLTPVPRHLRRHPLVLGAIETALRRWAARGVEHYSTGWRNICLCHYGGTLTAVLVDMTKTGRRQFSSEAARDWTARAIDKFMDTAS
jgi:hypothetical protein